MKKLLFVYNPHSGTGTIAKYLSEIITIFTAGGYDVTVHPTCAPLDGQEYITENSDGYDLIVSSGGDGMLYELVNAAVRLPSDRKYGYIPTGTINDCAASLGIPKDVTKAAEIIMGDNFIRPDAGKFGDAYFSYVAAFGMFTDVSYSTDQRAKNTFGVAAYLMNAIRSLDLRHFMETSAHMTIEANGEVYEDEFIFGLCGNTFSVGGMQNVVPYGADLTDGLLEGLFIRTPKNPLELQNINMALINRNFDCPHIITTQSDRFMIRSEKEVAWTLDGEDGGRTTEIEISAVPSAYEIAVARGVAAPLGLIPAE